MATINGTYVPTWEHNTVTGKVLQLDVPHGADLWVYYLEDLLIAAVDWPTAHAIFLDVDRYCATHHAPDECALCATTDEFAEDVQL